MLGQSNRIVRSRYLMYASAHDLHSLAKTRPRPLLTPSHSVHPYNNSQSSGVLSDLKPNSRHSKRHPRSRCIQEIGVARPTKILFMRGSTATLKHMVIARFRNKKRRRGSVMKKKRQRWVAATCSISRSHEEASLRRVDKHHLRLSRS